MIMRMIMKWDPCLVRQAAAQACAGGVPPTSRIMHLLEQNGGTSGCRSLCRSRPSYLWDYASTRYACVKTASLLPISVAGMQRLQCIEIYGDTL